MREPLHGNVEQAVAQILARRTALSARAARGRFSGRIHALDINLRIN
ncbi:hypothetical protein RSPO_c03203 [Ralstonia solanacearum Po82]|uniref:Uncharacterized protein n=1 Tax=Ralstonia solanacearum (strain Po82) TaxID=1031711 RepID=F6G5R7_RALS8|nr:hypothetical protein RSPO_c03203 [Ralstonia solanacearum Po82]